MMASSAARAPPSSSPDGHGWHAAFSEKRVKFVEHSEQNGPSCPSSQPPIPPAALEDPLQLSFDGHGSGRTDPLSALWEERRGDGCAVGHVGCLDVATRRSAERERAVVMGTQPTPSTGHTLKAQGTDTLAHKYTHIHILV